MSVLEPGGKKPGEAFFDFFAAVPRKTGDVGEVAVLQERRGPAFGMVTIERSK